MTEKPLIYIVDDDQFIQKLLKETLEAEGFRIQVAESAEECYRYLGMNIPDLFVLDIMLPGQDGYNLCQNLRKNKTTLFTPVLMLSSKSRVQDRIAGLEVGADDYLVKPFHLDELLARVKALLRRSYKTETKKAEELIQSALGSELTGQSARRQQLSKPGKTTAGTQKSEPRPTAGSSSKTLPGRSVSKPSSRPLSKPESTPAKPISKKPDKPPVNKKPVSQPVTAQPLIGHEADFETRKRFATELYQQRQYDQALQMFEDLSSSNPKDHYCRKYLEVTRTSMMKHYLKLLGSKDNVPIRTSNRPEDFIGLDFNTQEGFIFSRVDGVTDFKGIVAISGMKPLTAYGVLYNLMQSGVIKVK